MEQDLLNRLDRIDTKMDLLQDQINSLYKESMAKYAERIVALESRPAYPVVEHAAILARHEATINLLKWMMGVVGTATVALIIQTIGHLILK